MKSNFDILYKQDSYEYYYKHFQLVTRQNIRPNVTKAHKPYIVCLEIVRQVSIQYATKNARYGKQSNLLVQLFKDNT